MYRVATFAPGYSTEEYPDGFGMLTVDQKIDAFYQRYSFWIFDFAERLTATHHSGFALMLLLNPYFEMIYCKTHGISREERFGEHRKYRSDKLWKNGLKYVFRERLSAIEIQPYSKAICDCFYKSLRNELAHDGFIGWPVGLSEDYPGPFVVCPPNAKKPYLELSINPRAWYTHLRANFTEYVAQLKNPDEVKLRAAFCRSFE